MMSTTVDVLSSDLKYALEKQDAFLFLSKEFFQSLYF